MSITTKPTTTPPFPSFTKIWHFTSYPSISPTRPSLSCSGKNIFITGGGSGIGSRIVYSFAEAGASNIAILGRTETTLLSTKALNNDKFPNVKIHVFVADVTKEEEVSKAVASFAKAVETGKIDVLISNAGYLPHQASIADTPLDEWIKTMSINFTANIILTQSFLKVAAENAVIVNVTSAVSHYPFVPNGAAYAVTKAAGVAFFERVQGENKGLRVVNIQPGQVDTDMSRKSGFPYKDDGSLPADFTVWLASEEATFTKGKYLYVNFDVDELVERKEEIMGSNVLTMNLEGWPFGAPVPGFLSRT